MNLVLVLLNTAAGLVKPFFGGPAPFLFGYIAESSKVEFIVVMSWYFSNNIPVRTCSDCAVLSCCLLAVVRLVVLTY